VSVRTSINVTAQASPSATARSVTGRTFFIGRTTRGPIGPTRVFGPAEFVSRFGGRATNSQAMYDAVMAYFAAGGVEAVIVRAVGSAAVKASVTLTLTNSIVVTALEVGDYANTWTAGYDTATKTLTITTDTGVETYTGADLASLLTAASASTTVAVTSPSSALPTGNVAATALASGADQFATATLSAQLDQLPATWGPGVIVVPGYAHSDTFAAAGAVGATLAAHCATVGHRDALVSSPGTVNTAAGWESDKAVVRALANSHLLTPCWPAVVQPIATGATQVLATVDPCAVVAGRRAAAHGIGPWVSGIRADLREIPGPTDVAYQLTDAQALTAFASGGVLLRRENRPDATVVVVGSWKTASTITGDTAKHLHGLQHRDLCLAIAYEGSVIGSGQEGITVDGDGSAVGAFEAYLRAMLEKYVSAGALYAKRNPDGSVLPAYTVDTSSAVNTTESLAAGILRASVRVRLSPVAEYVVINIVAGDAGLAL
jgi:hypothetical protein